MRFSSSKYVVYVTASVHRELYGKITDPRKKDGVNNFLILNIVLLPRMYQVPVSCADFKAILTLFSGVIRKRCLSF